MKVNGKKVSSMSPIYVVIPKGDDEFVFKAVPVLDYTDFEKLCPVPQPPEIIRPGGVKSYDVEDKEYSQAIMEYSTRKFAWMVITSLRATDGLEWDTVDYAKPETWDNYEADLKQTFTNAEIAKILNTAHEACGLNQDKIEEATKRFLAGLAEEQNKQ